MLTIGKIKTDFLYVKALTGNSESYHDSIVFEGYGDLCDLYFKSKDKQLKQEQVDKYNDFKTNFKNYLPEIEKYINSSLRNSEINLSNLIRQTRLTIDIIEVPYDNYKYDLVLVCGKTYKKLIF